MWIIAIGTILKYALSLEMSSSACIVSGVGTTEYTTYTGCWMTISTVVPLAIMVVIYLATAIKLNRSTVALERTQSRLSLLEENKRVFRMFLVVVILYFLLTAPYSVYYFIQAYLYSALPNKIDRRALGAWNYGLFVVSVLNSCVNPIIYGRMYKEVNRQIKRAWIPFTNRSRKHGSHLRLETHNQYELSKIPSNTRCLDGSNSKISYECKDY